MRRMVSRLMIVVLVAAALVGGRATTIWLTDTQMHAAEAAQAVADAGGHHHHDDGKGDPDHVCLQLCGHCCASPGLPAVGLPLTAPATVQIARLGFDTAVFDGGLSQPPRRPPRVQG